MTSGEKAFLILLVVNFIIAVLYLSLSLLLKIVWKKETFRSILPKTAVMLLCPVVGVGFVALGYLCHKLVFYRAVDLEDVIFSKERIKPQMPAEVEKESNLAPVEEAVAIMDKDDLRRMMMQVVQGDIKTSLAAVSAALNSDDSEASHYAAAALQSMFNEFRMSVEKNYERITAEKKEESQQEREERLTLLEKTVDAMAKFMKQRLLTENEQVQYAGVMDELCELLFEKDAGRMTAELFEAVSMQQLEAKDYENCRKWCLRAYAVYPEALESYVCQLKLYFATEEREDFFRVLGELRSSDIVIDKETLEMIRVFL